MRQLGIACQNGKWHIADVDGISGEVMLVGLGSNGGSIMQINMASEP